MKHFDTSELGRYVRATKTPVNTFFIEWNLVETDIPGTLDADYQVTVDFSESPETDWAPILDDIGVPIAINYGDAYSYTWASIVYDFNRKFYFRLHLVYIPTLVEVESTVKYPFGQADGLALVVSRNEALLYRNWTGYPAEIWRAKHEGTTCPECWNPYTQTSSKSHCETCDGSGFLKGHFDPIKVQIAFEYGNETMVTSQAEIVTKGQMQARASNYPMISPEDLVLDMTNAKRFVVKDVQLTQLPNIRRKKSDLSGTNVYIISQILTLVEITSSDIEYTALTPV